MYQERAHLLFTTYATRWSNTWTLHICTSTGTNGRSMAQCSSWSRYLLTDDTRLRKWWTSTRLAVVGMDMCLRHALSSRRPRLLSTRTSVPLILSGRGPLHLCHPHRQICRGQIGGLRRRSRTRTRGSTMALSSRWSVNLHSLSGRWPLLTLLTLSSWRSLLGLSHKHSLLALGGRWTTWDTYRAALRLWGSGWWHHRMML